MTQHYTYERNTSAEGSTDGRGEGREADVLLAAVVLEPVLELVLQPVQLLLLPLLRRQEDGSWLQQQQQ